MWTSILIINVRKYNIHTVCLQSLGRWPPNDKLDIIQI